MSVQFLQCSPIHFLQVLDVSNIKKHNLFLQFESTDCFKLMMCENIRMWDTFKVLLQASTFLSTCNTIPT